MGDKQLRDQAEYVRNRNREARLADMRAAAEAARRRNADAAAKAQRK